MEKVNKKTRIAFFDLSLEEKKIFTDYLAASCWDLNFYSYSQLDNIKKNAKKIDPDICVIAFKNNFIVSDIKNAFVNSKIIILSYNEFSENSELNLLADRIFIIPCSLFKIYTEIKKMLGYTEVFPFERSVLNLLKNILPVENGFQYICTAVCLCIMDKKNLSRSTSLYNRISEISSIPVKNVGQIIRKYTNTVYENNYYQNLNDGKKIDTPISYLELIAMATDYFANHYKLFS